MSELIELDMEEDEAINISRAITSEKEEQAALIELLILNHALVIRVNSGRRGKIAMNRWMSSDAGSHTAGVSDLIAILPDGEVWFIECKRARGRVSEEQEIFRVELEKRGQRWMTSEQAFKELEV